ncbi:MAG: acetyl-CoA acetyltransferase [Pelagibacterales bacterium]|nr:acetyl-CoA acetyltransferase [Pelagibacterales bacterium]|tara:strand:- start:6442 stop:7650 length:1209 start_codon:yes stop_codon:yes gene_type:complete
MSEAIIYDAVRTPRGKGKKSGSLNEVPPVQLASKVLQAIEKRNNLNTADIDDVVLGCVHPTNEQGADIARSAVLEAKWDQTVSGVQVDRFCASGLEAVNIAAGQIMSGQADMSIGGGVESMSRVPMGSSGGAWMADPTVAYNSYFVPQGISADLLATKYGYTRTDVDSYAVDSQKRADNAWKEKRFKKSIINVEDQNQLTILDKDEYMRPNTTMQSLASLDPSFAHVGKNHGFDEVAILKYPDIETIDHVHHAGNSSGIVDGAAAVLIGNKEMGNKYELKPRAKIRSFASIGSEPTIMLTGPADSAEKALKRANMEATDIDLFEMNEAFAAVVLRFMDALNVDHSKVNVNGGAIALGHPLGATGAIILGTVLDELERRDLSTGLITLCVGAGMGTATIIERI